MKIVLADESDILRSRLRELISEVPKASIVGEASTTDETIELIQQYHPHLLFINFHLSDGSGLATLRQIKSSASSPLVIMLTEDASSEYQDSCRSAGADYVFDQAIDISEIRRLIEQLAQLGFP